MTPALHSFSLYYCSNSDEEEKDFLSSVFLIHIFSKCRPGNDIELTTKSHISMIRMYSRI